jgi:hypothetical protein
MSRAQVAGGPERLPWLADEPQRPRTRAHKPDLTLWAIAAVLLVAAVSFWLGSRSQPVETPPRTAAEPSAPIAVPAPPPAPSHEVRIAPQPQVIPAPEPRVRVIRVPEVRYVPAPRVSSQPGDQPKQPAAEQQPAQQSSNAPEKTVAPGAAVPAPAPPVARPAPLTPWPPRVSAGAYGRLVQIGAYGSRLQAKRGWVAMVRAYPAVAHLPAVVVETRNSRRRLFYRFQVGTTSQAHSEVLCQRMQRIQLSCAIVGLPWKPKIER